MRKICFSRGVPRIFLNHETACQASEKLMKSDRFSNVGVHPPHLFELKLFFLDKNEILLQYRFHDKLNTHRFIFTHPVYISVTVNMQKFYFFVSITDCTQLLLARGKRGLVSEETGAASEGE